MPVLLSGLLSVENYSSFGPKVMRAKNCVLNHGAPKYKKSYSGVVQWFMRWAHNPKVHG